MKDKKVAIIHYTYPPVIGGVENVIENHAQMLAEDGYKVKVLSGVGESQNRVEVKVIPQLQSLSSVDGGLDKDLKRGKVPERFHSLKDEIRTRLEKELKDVDTCIIHNILTMHFNLPLSCALDELIEKLHPEINFYLWCHDSALINPSYKRDIPYLDRYPWDILSRFNPDAGYIAISNLRKKQLASLFSISPSRIEVIPVGVDIKSFLGISDTVWQLAWDKGFFETDLVMLFPSRIVARKNYELGLKVTEQINKMGKKCKFVLTAPPDPHNPEATEYFNYLHKLSEELDVQEEVIFLYDWKDQYGLQLDYKEIKDLYSICDILFVTSTQEGFGIPLLEAGAKKIPIVCTDIEPLTEVAEDYALRVSLKQDPANIAREILHYLESIPTFNMFKRVVLKYSWKIIYKKYLKKLVDNHAKDRNC